MHLPVVVTVTTAAFTPRGWIHSILYVLFENAMGVVKLWAVIAGTAWGLLQLVEDFHSYPGLSSISVVEGVKGVRATNAICYVGQLVLLWKHMAMCLPGAGVLHN